MAHAEDGTIICMACGKKSNVTLENKCEHCGYRGQCYDGLASLYKKKPEPKLRMNLDRRA